MEVERLVVKLVSDSTQYIGDMNRVGTQMESTIRRMVSAGRVDPFQGLTVSAQRAVLAQAAALQQLQNNQRRMLDQFNRGELGKVREFDVSQQNKAEERARKFIETQGVRAQRFAAEMTQRDQALANRWARQQPRSATGQLLPYTNNQLRQHRRDLQVLQRMRQEFAAEQQLQQMRFERSEENRGGERRRQFETQQAAAARRFTNRQANEYAKAQDTAVKAILRLTTPSPEYQPGFTRRAIVAAATPVGLGTFAARRLGVDIRGGDRVRTLNDDIKQLSQTMHQAWGPAARLIAILGVGGLTGIAVLLGKNTLVLAAHYQSTAIAMEVMIGSAQRAEKVMKDIIQLGIESPFKTPELIAIAKQLKAFGFETDQLLPTLRALGEVSAGTGTPLNRIALAFGQIRVAGRLMGPEMRQLIDAGIPIIENLAAVMGKPEQAIKGMVENAEVSYQDVVRAFNRMTQSGGLFFGLMERQSRTVEGRWSAFVETLQLGAIKVGNAFFEEFGTAQFLDDFRAKVAEIVGTGNVKQFHTDAEGNITEVKGPMTGGIENTQGIVDFIKEIKAGWKVFEDIITATAKWVGQNKELVSTILKIGGGLLLTIGAVVIITKVIGLLIFGLVALKVAAIAMGIVLAAAFLTAITPIETLQAAWKGFKKMWDEGFLSPKNLFAGVGEALERDLTMAFSKSGEVWTKMWNNFAVSFKGAWQGVKDAFASGDISLAFDIIIDTIQLAWKTLMTSLRAEWVVFTKGLVEGPAYGSVAAAKALNDANAFAKRQANTRGPAAEAQINRERDMLNANLEAEYQDAVKAWKNKVILEDPRIKEIMDSVKPIENRLKNNNEKARLGLAMKTLDDSIKGYLETVEVITGIEGNKFYPLQKTKQYTFDAEKKVYGTGDEESRLFQKEIGVGVMGGGISDFMLSAREQAESYAAMTAKIAEESIKQNRPGTPLRIEEAKKAIDIARSFSPEKTPGVGGGTPGSGDGMKAALTVSGLAMEQALEVQKMMKEGKGAFSNPYSTFRREMDLLEEAYYGPPKGAQRGVSSVIGGLGLGGIVAQKGGPVLNTEQFKFGAAQKYMELFKSLPQFENKMPTGAQKGSVEAQDIINAANAEKPLGVMENVLEVLKQSYALEKEQAEQRNRIEEKLKTIIDNGLVAPGGF